MPFARNPNFDAGPVLAVVDDGEAVAAAVVDALAVAAGADVAVALSAGAEATGEAGPPPPGEPAEPAEPEAALVPLLAGSSVACAVAPPHAATSAATSAR